MRTKSVVVIAVTCLIVALSALMAFSAEPPKAIAVDGPERCEPYKLVRLAVTGEVDSAVWFIEPAEQADLAIQPGGKATVFIGPPGKYVVNLVGIKAGQLSQARKLVTIGEPEPTPPPTPNPHRPAPQWKAAAEPVSKCKLSHQDATGLAAMYAQVSKDAQTDTALSTTADLRARLVQHGQALGLKGKYPAAAEAIETCLRQALGLDNVPLDKAQAAALLETIAWAVWEAGR